MIRHVLKLFKKIHSPSRYVFP